MLVVTWWTGAGGTGTNLGTGASKVVGPGTYYARVTGDCGAAVEASVTVATSTNVGITSVTPAATPICPTGTTVVSANGVVGTNAVVTWYTGAGGTGTNLGTGLSTTQGPGTYYARVTGDCGAPVESSTTVASFSGAANVILTSTTTGGAVEQCVDNGWTYYANPATPNQWIFAIRKNGSVFDANVTITTTPSVISNFAPAQGHGSYLIPRYWDVVITSGSITTPVDVRFYFDPAEKTAAESARDAALSAYQLANPTYLRYPTPFRWFKTIGAPFNPNLIVGNDFSGFGNVTLAEAGSGTENGVNFVRFDGITSFSGGTGGFGFGTGGTGLPVKLLYLQANAIENSFIKLDWATAVEIDNKGFEIQRSTNGQDFTTIGWVDGNGNSTQTITYKYDDRDVQSGITYYYRLKQIDYDGDFEYSNIVSASLIGENSFDLMGMYPNPTTGKVVLAIMLPDKQDVTVGITDVLGRNVGEQSFDKEKGFSHIELDFSNLADGTYSVTIQSGTSSISKKLVIAR
jgi:hypothetical protein